MGMGSGNSIQVTASEQGGVVSEPVMGERRDVTCQNRACSMSTNQEAFKLDSRTLLAVNYRPVGGEHLPLYV